MAKPNKFSWIEGFTDQSPVFAQLKQAHDFAQYPRWPSLSELQQGLDLVYPDLCSEFGTPIKFVPQARKPQTFEDEYEVRIFQRGEIQTRHENWHDFFNALIWMNYARIKQRVNALHYRAMLKRVQVNQLNRNRMENKLTHFDECGAIIISSQVKYLDWIRNRQWKKLFYENRNVWQNGLYCFLFGHALFEKLLNPYIGLCAHALLFACEREAIDKQNVEDMVLSQLESVLRHPLQPFPLLGVPGWYKQQDEEFYAQQDYFRAKS